MRLALFPVYPLVPRYLFPVQVFQCRLLDFRRDILQFFESYNISEEIYLLVELELGWDASLPACQVGSCLLPPSPSGSSGVSFFSSFDIQLAVFSVDVISQSQMLGPA